MHFQCIVVELLKADPQVVGLFWFAYDASYKEGNLSGAANVPSFVHTVEGLN
jgi:hypothetical protein